MRNSSQEKQLERKEAQETSCQLKQIVDVWPRRKRWTFKDWFSAEDKVKLNEQLSRNMCKDN